MATDFRIPIVADGGNFESELRRSVMAAMDGVISDVRRSMGDVNSALGDVDTSGMEGASSAARDIAAAINQVNPANLEQTASAANNVAQAAQRAAEETRHVGEGADPSGLNAIQRAAQGVVEEATRATREAAQIGQGVDPSSMDRAATSARGVGEAAQRAARETEQLGNSSRQAGQEAENAFSGAGAELGAMAGKAAAAGVAIGGIAGSVGEAMGRADVAGKLGAQLDLTKTESEKAGKIAGAVFESGFGDSFGTVSDAVGAVHSSIANLGTTSDAEMKRMVTATQILADAFEMDVGQAAGTAGTLIQNGLAKNGVEALDLLTAASQRVPSSMREELPDLINEYGTFFSSLGFNGEQAFATLVDASAGGQIAMDKAGDAIKEFGIRATDIGDTGAQEALAAIGLNGQQMANDLLAGGDTAKGAFDKIVGGLNGMTDPAAQAEAAVKLFGTPLEDLDKAKIPGFLEAMSGASGSMEGFAGASERAGASLDTPQSKLSAFTRTLQGDVIGALGGIAGYFIEHTTQAKILAGVLGGLVGTILLVKGATMAWSAAQTAWTTVTTIATGVQWAFNAAMAANPIGIVVIAIAALVAGLVAFFTKTEAGKAIWQDLVGEIQTAWAAIQVAFDAAWQFIQVVWDGIIGGVQGVIGWMSSFGESVNNAFGTVAAFFQNLPGRILEIIGDAAGWLWQKGQDILIGLANGIGQGANAVWDFYTSLPGRILGFLVEAGQWLWQKGSDILHGLASGITEGASAVWDFLSSLPGRFWDFFVEAHHWLYDKGIDILHGMRDGITNGAEAVWGFISGIPGVVLSKIGNVGSTLVQSGKDLIQGFLDGAGSLLKDIGRFFLDKLPGWIREPFKKALGIESPSKVFRLFGTNLVQGLEVGIEKEIPSLVKQMESLARTVADTNIEAPALQPATDLQAFTAPAAGAGGETGAGGPVGVDPEQLKEITVATVEADTTLQATAANVLEFFNPAIVSAQTTALAFGQSVTDAALMHVAPATQMIQQAAASTGNALLNFANAQASPALSTVQAAAQLTGQVMLDVANLQANPALNSVGVTTQNLATLVGTTVNDLLNPTIVSVGTTTNNLAVATGVAVNEQILPTWSNMATSLEATRAGQIDPTLNALQSAVGTTADSFRTGVDMATQHWDRLKEATAAPVRWTIDQVFNRGVQASWNAVSEMLGTKPMAPIPINFARGGQVGKVRGPGGGIEDRVPGAVPRGSFILRTAASRRLDPRLLARMNDAAGGLRQKLTDLVPVNLSAGETWLSPAVVKKLGLENLQRFNKGNMDPQGLFPSLSAVSRRLSAGGLVEGTPAWNALKRAHDWARSRNGRPYVLGGSADGGGGTDCSGFMSGIANVIQGGNGARQWATMAFNGGGNSQQPSGPQGFVAGLAAGFSIGVLNGGPAGGHTAGTLGGVPGLPTVNVESGGSHGNVAYGGPAAGADHSQFPTKYHLPIVDGAFVSGGGGGGHAVDYVALVRQKIDPIWEGVKRAIDGRPFAGRVGEIPPAARAKMQQIVTDKLVGLAQAMQATVGSDPGGSGVERWRPLVKDLLMRYGFPAAWEQNTMRRMAQENASGDPKAVNDYDVNWQNGTPSVGLMQVIRPTYMDHKDPALDKGPYLYGVSTAPDANVAASMRYAMARYGSLPAAYDRPGGYFRGGSVFDDGGIAAGLGFLQKHVLQPERVLSPRQTKAFESLVQIIGKFSSARSFSDLERIFKEQLGNMGTMLRDFLPEAVEKGVGDAVKEQTTAAQTIAAAVAGEGKAAGVSVFDEVEGKLLRSHPDLFKAGRSTSSREEVAAAEEAERQKRLEEMRKAQAEAWEKFKTEILPKIEQGWQGILSSPEVQGFKQQAEAFGAQAAGAFQGFMRQHGVPGFDLGGVANGTGLMPKNTIRPERVLSPQQTRTFDSVVPLLERLQRWQVTLRAQLANAYRERMMEASHRRTIYAPFTVNGMPERVAREAQNRLLSLLDS